MELAAVIALPVLAVIFIFEAVKGYRDADTLGNFYLMGGKLHLPSFVGTLAATNFSLGNMIFLSLIWGYFFGFSGVLWLCIGFVLAALVYIWFVRSSRLVSGYIEDVTNSGSLHEYLYISYSDTNSPTAGRLLRLFASLATVLCVLIALTLELYLAIGLLAPVFHISVTAGFVALTALICLYSSIGGFFAVVKTDVLQGGLLIFAVISLGFLLTRVEAPWTPYTET
jgi:sodium/proline symporter